MKIKFLTFALLLFTTLVSADDPITIIRARQMLDVKTGKLIPDAVIVVQADRILSIQPSELPKNASTIDLGDRTLLPGLIDMHTHLTYDSVDFRLDIGKQPGAATAGRALLGAKFARITLLAGFTTVRDLGACCYSDITLMRAIEKGITEGPDIFPSGHIITITGGACDQTSVNPDVRKAGTEEGIADNPEEIAEAVRYQLKYGAKVIKTCGDDNNFTEQELTVMADAAHRRRAKLAVHVSDENSVRIAVNAGTDSIEHATEMNEEILDNMIKKGIYLVPTMYTIDPAEVSKIPEQFRKQFESEIPKFEKGMRDAVRKGVKIAFGSDTGQIEHGQNAKEFGKLVYYGMTPLQAIQAATVNAADLLGVKDRGAIGAGLRADLIAVDGNPLENIKILEDVKFVMKAGKIYKHNH
jgi:imidazolonepropionase-like amidohydrolase